VHVLFTIALKDANLNWFNFLAEDIFENLLQYHIQQKSAINFS